MNKLDKQYTDLLQDILDNGVTKQDRTGTGTISVFGRQIRHRMSDGFPLLTTKKMPFKTMVTELLWFLRGDTNIKYLVDNGCNIWNGDAFKRYESSVGLSSNPHDYKIDSVSSVEGMEGMGAFKIKGSFAKEEFIEKIKTDDRFAKKWGDLGPIYGKQWRSWETYKKWETDFIGTYSHSNSIDQIANLINDLKTNPDSRRLMVNAWNVGEIDSMVLPPCHYGFQVYTRELSEKERTILYFEKYGYDSVNMEGNDLTGIPTRAISLMWNQRSVDTFLGLPFNIASYGLLLEIIAKEVNMVPDELIGNLGDTHLYLNHIDQAKEQIGKLTIEERMDYWFKNNKPNRDVCDSVDEYSSYIKEAYFDHAGVPRTSREPYPLPKLLFKDHLDQFDSIIDILRPIDFVLDNYQSHPTIKAPLSN